MKNNNNNTAPKELINFMFDRSLVISMIIVNLTILVFNDSIAQKFSNDSLLIAGNGTSPGPDFNVQSAGKESPAINQPFFNRLINSEDILNDFLGAKDFFDNAGIDFELVYKGEIFSNTLGGFNRSTTTLDNIDLIFSADLGKSVGIKNTFLTTQFLGNSGGTPCDFTGASQGISNIETVTTWKLYQFLIETKLFDNRFSVMAGLYDLNSEFDTRESSSVFINPSHGIGPDFAQSGLNGPSIFPTTSATLRLKYESENGIYAQTAVLDGVPGNPANPYGTHIIFNKNDGMLLTVEMGFLNDSAEENFTKVAFGLWTYTTNFEKINFSGSGDYSESFEKNYGIYLNAEYNLSSNSGFIGKKSDVFLRLGAANKNINPIDLYIGSGINISGLLDDNDKDVLGFSIAYAHNAFAYRNAALWLEQTATKSYEINIEATYSFNLMPWFKIQPDIQYLINPTYCTKSNNALVLGSRVEITL